MRTILACLMLAVGLLLGGCHTEATYIERTKKNVRGLEYVTIGTVSADRDTQRIVRTSLQQIGIPCFMPGTAICDIDVPLARYPAALKKLKQEPQLEGKRFGHFWVFRKARS
jgi:hypothetical protein